ncbi:MAG TPA: CarD family transcriptional regulator [Halanaerobiales bacterium]|nr:CarD family transcriptional regulator [Halanaerobiales bacterium]
MFDKGDKVVYPNHGAGTIEGIETKEILGEEKKYYTMRLPIGDMKVMIPVDKVDEIGVREVIDAEEADNVIELLKGEKSKMSQNWNRRYRANQEKLKTGDIYEVGGVVRDLTIRDERKGLSTGEKKMLSNAKQILISELVLAKDATEEEIRSTIEEAFENNPHIQEEEEED